MKHRNRIFYIGTPQNLTCKIWGIRTSFSGSGKKSLQLPSGILWCLYYANIEIQRGDASRV